MEKTKKLHFETLQLHVGQEHLWETYQFNSGSVRG